MKRILALLLCLVMAISLIPAAAAEDIEIVDIPEEDGETDLIDIIDEALPEEGFAEETAGTRESSGSCGESVRWVLGSTGTLTISGSGAMYDYWPWADNAAPPWSASREQIKKIVIKSGVTSIGSYAFYDCRYAESVTIADTVTSIGTWAFCYCHALASLSIPCSVKRIGAYAFAELYSLTSLTIPNSVTSIGAFAFNFCNNLTSVSIGTGLSEISQGVFDGCSAMTSFKVASGNKYFCVSGGVLFSKDKTRLVEAVLPLEGSYAIPSSVTTIDPYAFAHCRLTGVTIPSGVTNIGFYAFAQSRNLKSITVPASVTEIGERAFHLCNSLESIKVASGNKNYSSQGGILYDKAKTVLIQAPGAIVGPVTVPSTVTELGDTCFGWCSNLKGVTLPEGLKRINRTALYWCRSLETLHIPASVEDIATGSLERTPGMKSITVASGNKNYSSLNGVLFNKDRSTLLMAPGAISGAYTVPSTVTRIARGSFEMHENLTAITIPASVKTIDDFVFWWCDNLTDVYYTGTPTQWDKIEIGGSNDPLLAANLHFITKPEILTQPASKSVTAGKTVKFTVQAAGATSYQWYYRKNSSSSWVKSGVSGNTTATLTVEATAARNGYQYRCAAKNAYGTTYSKTATLTVVKAPSITTQPSAKTVAAGATASFTVKASGVALKYQWYWRRNASGAWNKSTLDSASTATLKVEATAAREGFEYRCKVWNAAGTVYTEPAALHVKPAITSQPASVTASAGETVKFTVKAAGPNLSYQWYYRTSESGSWNKASAAGSTTATITVEATAKRNGFQYYCKVYNDNGVAYSRAAALTVS